MGQILERVQHTEGDPMKIGEIMLDKYLVNVDEEIEYEMIEENNNIKEFKTQNFYTVKPTKLPQYSCPMVQQDDVMNQENKQNISKYSENKQISSSNDLARFIAEAYLQWSKEEAGDDSIQIESQSSQNNKKNTENNIKNFNVTKNYTENHNITKNFNVTKTYTDENIIHSLKNNLHNIKKIDINENNNLHQSIMEDSITQLKYITDLPYNTKNLLLPLYYKFNIKKLENLHPYRNPKYFKYIKDIPIHYINATLHQIQENLNQISYDLQNTQIFDNIQNYENIQKNINKYNNNKYDNNLPDDVNVSYNVTLIQTAFAANSKLSRMNCENSKWIKKKNKYIENDILLNEELSIDNVIDDRMDSRIQLLLNENVIRSRGGCFGRGDIWILSDDAKNVKFGTTI
eukprot:GHVL01038938.1.p1 GENE.GHVL01038938.1~~GHVL01038938.1.p1  ORF type:complete len:465 (+),score=132.03 GHVL01038938.1:192-1397(+)